MVVLSSLLLSLYNRYHHYSLDDHYHKISLLLSIYDHSDHYSLNHHHAYYYHQLFYPLVSVSITVERSTIFNYHQLAVSPFTYPFCPNQYSLLTILITYGKSPWYKSTISMPMFNSYYHITRGKSPCSKGRSTISNGKSTKKMPFFIALSTQPECTWWIIPLSK